MIYDYNALSEDDDRLYYKEYSQMEATLPETHPPFVEISTYKPSRSSCSEHLLAEPHVMAKKSKPVVCRNETGQCCCAQQRAAALETCSKDSCGQKQTCGKTSGRPPPEEVVCRTVSPAASSENPVTTPSTTYTVDKEEKLYISVDTHTDNTVVESRSIQTLKDEANSCCGTQTYTVTPSGSKNFENSEPTSSATVRRASAGTKRTYSILSGQRKSDENAAVDKETAKVNVAKTKSAKPAKCAPQCEVAKSLSSSSARLTAVVKKK